MKSIFSISTLFLLIATTSFAKTEKIHSRRVLSFIENNGQIRDQNGMPRNDIGYVLQGGNINIFIGDGQLHYQFYKTVVTNGNQPGTYIAPELRKDANEDRYEAPLSAKIHTYRLDAALIGANKNAQVVEGIMQPYYENYFLPGCPAEGIRAHSYNKITYKNVYPDIDWVIYTNGNKLEHEFVVGKHGDASKIKIQYKGQTALSINSEGSIVAATPMGVITEKAPVCYSANGTKVPSAYKLNGDVLSYDLNGFKEAVLIDPELIWGTYYGPDSISTTMVDVAVYDSASMYACGLTWSGDAGSIATSGGFQSVFGGFTDAFVVKFDTGGIRQWATYYGGTDGDYATGITCDHHGMIYVVGVTASTTGMATAGAAQTTYGGNPYDGFLLKLAPDGARRWATYIGGNGANYPWSVSCDLTNLIYVAGDTNEPTNVATPTGYRPTKSGGFDWFLIQYDTVGAKQWGTYYGGPSNEWSGNACTDGYVEYLTGWTTSPSGIASPLSHQPAIGGLSDAAIVKFYVDGTFSWGTYYGGSGSETVGSITTDIFRNIYLLGHTNSDDAISTPAGHQPARGGLLDAFVVKLHPEIGFRMWGTYIGGPSDERTDYSRIATDDSANLYVIGYTTSTSGLSTDTAWQTVYGGGDKDGFLGKFNHIGEMKWLTYFGGSGSDEARSVKSWKNAAFLCGITTSPDSITTPGAYLPVGGGSAWNTQGFLAKFSDPDTTSIPEDTTTIPVDTSTFVTSTPMGENVALSIFPNPNTGAFSIHGKLGSQTGIAAYIIADASGRILRSDKTAVHSGTIDEQISIGNLPNGIYFLRILPPGQPEQAVTFRKE